MERAGLAVRVEEARPGPHGHRPDERPVEEHLRLGVVAVDKPKGPTSHQVAAWVRDVLGVEKAGHGGTLDPNVTGVLPMGLDDATKVLPLLLEAGKEYVGVMRLHGDVPRKVLEKAFRQYVGTVEQTPPVRSAVKRERRTREVYQLRLLEWEGRDVLFRVKCEAGTYIRKLVHDMGESTGPGAHMEELRRTRAGTVDEGDAVTLHELKDAHAFWTEDGDDRWLRDAVRPLETVLAPMKRVVVRDTAVDALSHGAPLAVPGIVAVEKDLAVGDTCAVTTLKGEAVLWGEAKLDADVILAHDSGIAVVPERVVMRPGTYPKGW